VLIATSPIVILISSLELCHEPIFNSNNQMREGGW
jgi:hypothetical protein